VEVAVRALAISGSSAASLGSVSAGENDMGDEILFPKGCKMTITPQPWIAVSEDLPERGEEVLVTDSTRCGVASFVDGYRDCVDTQEWDGTPIVPTHWMPLPALPTDGW
jgi:hypothetical protein